MISVICHTYSCRFIIRNPVSLQEHDRILWRSRQDGRVHAVSPATPATDSGAAETYGSAATATPGGTATTDDYIKGQIGGFVPHKRVQTLRAEYNSVESGRSPIRVFQRQVSSNL